MKYPSFFSNPFNRALSIILFVLVLGFIALVVFFSSIKDAGYVSLKEYRLLDVTTLGKEKILEDNNYFRLYNFCMDEEIMTYTKSNIGGPDAYYVFLNGECDSIPGPEILIEMESDMYQVFSNVSDSTRMVEKFFTGRLFKGYEGDYASGFAMFRETKDKDIYTFKPGLTPQKVKTQNLFLSIKVLAGMSLGIAIAIVALISNETQRRKLYRKQFENGPEPGQE